MTYETVRDAAKELALNAIAIEKRDNSDSAAKIAIDAIRIHERAAWMDRYRETQNPELISNWVGELQQLDAALM